MCEGFSLQDESGRSLALLGQSGSGKSTVISLIERFYDEEAGQVREFEIAHFGATNEFDCMQHAALNVVGIDLSCWLHLVC